MPETRASRADLLREAGARLAAARVPEPRREAHLIWAGLRGQTPGSAFLDADRPVEASEAEAFRAAVARRAQGEPLAHVVGWTEFRTLHLRTDRRALIPRPETEGLVDLILARAPRGRAADIGTGTGCLALSLRAEGDYDAVLAVDFSADALALAGENAAAAAIDIQLVRADLTSALAEGSLDALVSNPPYLTEAEYATLDGAVREWEPRLALPSGADGLAATRRLLDDGRRVLRPGGWMALEVDCARAREAASAAAALGWCSVTVKEDLFGRERYLLAQRSETR